MTANALLIVGLAWFGALLMPVFKSHRAAVIFALLTAVSSFSLLFTSSDGLGVLLTLIATVIGALAVIFSVDYMRDEAQIGRYYALVLMFIGAMTGLVLSDRLLLLFIFWEITALCSYALISFHNDDPKAVAGGIKALIITQIGGVGLLGGALLAQSAFGTDSITVFLTQSSTLAPQTLSLIAFGFLVAAAAKSAQVPFFTWLPGAMEAPTPVSALIHAATMVNAGVYLLVRFYPAFVDVPGWTLSVALIGMLSALLGALMALTASDLKRVLAYSTISQLGYMVYAIGIGAVFASQFHLLSHAVFKALLFLSAGAVIHATGTRDLNKMGGLGQRMPFVRAVFITGALALSGIPIFNGFWSKELILEHGEGWMALVMLVGAGLTALYALRLVWLVFYGQTRSELHPHDAATAMRVALGVLALGTLVTWLFPLHTLLDAGEVDVVGEVIHSPSTVVTLLITAVGLGLWIFRRYSGWFNGLNVFTGMDFGFEWINRQTVNGTRAASALLRETQTGQLNWNLAAVLGALIVLLATLMGGGLQ